MSNMSYCRFRNTYGDLRDCHDNICDDDLSEEEYNARKDLIELCKEIADSNFDEDGDPTGDWAKSYRDYKKDKGDDEDEE